MSDGKAGLIQKLQVARDEAIPRILARHCRDSKDGLFIIGPDTSPTSSKRLVFIQACLLNLFIICCVSVLAWTTIFNDFYDTYPAALHATFALTHVLVVGTASYILFRSTVFPFVFGECRLRWCYGFQKTEILVRQAPAHLRPTRHAARSLDSTQDKGSLPLGENDKYRSWISSIRKAIDPRLLYLRPSAILSNEYWTPDYGVLRDLYDSMREGGVVEDELLVTSIWERCDDGTWIIVECDIEMDKL
ncbi:hypothetical protein CC1G_03617 [Coprinopsis cinerea okayama7|uniref:Uncharacterized protein n=1 Tax=Coprinopsis cinerea (strain Okayama-7 / 130 / ATCC MYA-4618 / FGSC 9003) TaxID=240176 RepID=A8NCQ9_COPC7|nr:hypothetical protein CC1G_03617 [Coprinopsis cinerea okayama7\|eukprot:XP_001832603.1 hypothetical protein CC1G_03617 [Coprinopsis cinerea okayama7\